MNAAHAHLMVNHFPVIGGILATALLLSGIVLKNETVKRTAYFVFLISAIGAVFTFLSGEGAEEIVEKISGIDENLIEKHEEKAAFALWSSIIIGVLSAIGLYLSFKSSKLSGVFSFVVLLVSFITIYFSWQAGNSGGKIRHPEIDNAQTVQSTNKGEENEQD